MSVWLRSLQRPLWFVLAWLIGIGAASAAPSAIVGDFDGDGRHDRAELSAAEPSAVRIYLSTTHKTSVVHSKTPILSLVARDLDGDQRDELIVRGASARLQVWTKQRNRFAKVHPRHHASLPRARLDRHHVEQAPVDSALDPDPSPSHPAAIATTVQAVDAARNTTRVRARQVTGPVSPVFAPLGSRPPPARS
jgi:hypothetical protein